jgi:hypothetical protein
VVTATVDPGNDDERKVSPTADMMLQFHQAGGKPSIEEAMGLFGLSAEDIDQAYGVATTDPRDGLYVLLVKARAVPKVEAVLAKRRRHPAEGLFGNPQIEPMGPLPPESPR